MRKQRTREHIIEDLGFNHIERQVLYAGYTLQRYTHNDYGYDALLNTFSDNGEAESHIMYVQLKSTDQIILSLNYVTLQINSDMQTLNIYKDIQPTYGEWLPILEDLGYQKQVIDFISISKQKKQQYRLENPQYNSVILLPFLSDNEPVLKAHFASYSHLLYLQGVIEDEQDMAKKIENRRLHRAEEDLIKMVEKNRLKKNKSANLSNRV